MSQYTQVRMVIEMPDNSWSVDVFDALSGLEFEAKDILSSMGIDGTQVNIKILKPSDMDDIQKARDRSEKFKKAIAAKKAAKNTTRCQTKLIKYPSIADAKNANRQNKNELKSAGVYVAIYCNHCQAVHWVMANGRAINQGKTEAQIEFEDR